MTETVTHQAVIVAPKATGLACLVLVGRVHGMNLSVEQLVHDNALVMGEISARQLLHCATRAGFRCNLLALDWGSVVDLRNALPAIAVLTDNSSVVIAGTIVRDGVAQLLVQNPLAEGAEPVAVDRARFEEVWTGDILLLRRSVETVEDAQPFGFRMIATLMFQNSRELWEIGLCAIATSVFALTPMIFWMLLSARVINNFAEHTFVLLCVGGAVFVLFEAAFMALRRWVVVRLTARIDFALSTLMFERLLNLPIEYFETTPVGSITFKIAQMSKIRSFMTGQLFGTVLDAGVLVVFLPIMFYINAILTGIVLAFCSLSAGWIIAVLPLYRRRTKALEEAESDRVAFLAQTVSGIRTVKSLALDSRQQRGWDGLTAFTARQRLAEGDMRNVIQTVVNPIERLTMIAPIAIGIYLAMTQMISISISMLFVFVLMSQRLVAPLLQLAQLVQQYDDARSAVELVGDLLNRPAEEGRSGHGVRVPLRGHVEFVNLRFTYRGAVNPALRSISFEIPQGTTLGVMGRSGSGKTTITRLLQRLHSDYQGMIRIDGVDVREFDIDHLRSSLGVVLQENFLFSGTIRDNITAAKSDATFEEVVNAARLAGAEEFIDKLPYGYDTAIYEGSPNLSGGQRQRLAIARALITDPKVLILDEATSALDADSEAIVNANLRRIARGRTMIVISHRLSSLVTSDAILVLDQGEVHDIGKHHELLERCDIYSGLWHRQNAHAADEAAAPAPAAKLIARGAVGA